MIKTRKVLRKVESTEIMSITCDRCKKEIKYGAKDNLTTWIELVEFQSINFEAGYGSVFGDGNRVECDLCQDCLKKLIGTFARITAAK